MEYLSPGGYGKRNAKEFEKPTFLINQLGFSHGKWVSLDKVGFQIEKGHEGKHGFPKPGARKVLQTNGVKHVCIIRIFLTYVSFQLKVTVTLQAKIFQVFVFIIF